MDENIYQYIEQHVVKFNVVINYKIRDKYYIKDDQIYILSSENNFVNEFDTDKENYIIIELPDLDYVYYKLIPKEQEQITILLEQSKINEKIAQVQIEKLSSINAKLTFFVILTIINIIVSVILELR